MTVEFGSQVRPVNGWEDFVTWLVESFGAMGVGSLFEVGQRDTVVYAADDPVVCAQIVKLEDGVLWIRLSDVVLGAPMIADHTTERLPLDVWQFDDAYPDCTGGFLFSADHWLVAESCASWFRDRRGVDMPEALGCEYEPVDRLPRRCGPRKSPRPPRDEELEDCRALAEQYALMRFEDVRWIDKRLLSFTVEGKLFRLVVRRKKRRMDVFVEFEPDWADQLTEMACADFEGRMQPVSMVVGEGLVFLRIGFEVTRTVRSDLENSIGLLASILRSVECCSTLADLQDEAVKTFGQWRLDWGLFSDE